MVSALRIRPFGRLLTTYTLDEAADWLVGIALAVFVYERTQSALAVAALLLASRFGPSLAITPLAARLESRRLGGALAGLYLGAALVAATLAAVTAAPLWVLYGLTFVATTLASTARVLTRTAACNVLDEHGKLREGAAALNVSYGATNVLGPAVAGAVTVLIGTQLSVALGAAVFAGLAATTWRLQLKAVGEEQEGTTSLREGLALMASGPGVAAVMVAAAALLVLFSVDEPIMLPYAEQALGGDTTQFAAMLTAWGVGLLLGGGLFALLRHRSMLGTFVLSGALFAGAYVGLGLTGSAALAYAACIVGGMGNGIFWGALTVVTLEAVPPSVRTRTSGAIESIALAAPGLGYLLGGGLSEFISPAQVYVFSGVAGGCVVAALAVALRWPATRVALAAPALVTAAGPSTTQGR